LVVRREYRRPCHQSRLRAATLAVVLVQAVLVAGAVEQAVERSLLLDSR